MAIIASFLRPDTLYQMKVDENAAGNLLISFMRIRKKGELYVKEEKEKSDKKLLKLTVATCLLLTISYLALDFCSGLGLSHKVRVSEDWKLIVVNRWNKLPEDYRIELTELSNGEKVDSRIYPALQEMFDDARAEQIYPIVRDGYRTMEEQQKEMDEKIQAYMDEGYSRKRAEKTAEEHISAKILNV